MYLKKVNLIFMMRDKTFWNFEFLKKGKKIHGDKYDYSKFVYKKAKTKGKIICQKHGIFKQCPEFIISEEKDVKDVLEETKPH